MATRKESSAGTLRKQRSEGGRAQARAKGGGLRSQPADTPVGRSASTGGLTTRGMARDSRNSRSSNAGGMARDRAKAAGGGKKKPR